MTDRQGTARTTKQAEEERAWSIEGSAAFAPGDDQDLSDTVVRMPKISANGPAPTLPAPPSVRSFVPHRDPEPGRPESYETPTVGLPLSAAAEPLTPGGVPAGAAKPMPTKKSSLRRTRKARLRLSRIDAWSVMKTSFLFSIAFGIMFWVATWLLWTVVVNSGLFEAINSAIVNIVSNPSSPTTWRIEDYVNTNKVLGIAALLAVINVVITTALGTLAAFLYNLSANILGGLELTLAED